MPKEEAKKTVISAALGVPSAVFFFTLTLVYLFIATDHIWFLIGAIVCAILDVWLVIDAVKTLTNTK